MSGGYGRNAISRGNYAIGCNRVKGCCPGQGWVPGRAGRKVQLGGGGGGLGRCGQRGRDWAQTCRLAAAAVDPVESVTALQVPQSAFQIGVIGGLGEVSVNPAVMGFTGLLVDPKCE